MKHFRRQKRQNNTRLCFQADLSRIHLLNSHVSSIFRHSELHQSWLYMRTLFKQKNTLEALIAASADDAQVANMLHNSQWGLGNEQSWHLDQASGQLLLTFADGSFALAPAQIVGSYHHKEHSFMWAWNHPSVLPALKRNAMVVKGFGKEQSAKELTRGSLVCTEQRAWELTALAMRLNQAKGAYRVLVKPHVSLFLNFGEIQIAHEAQKA